MAAYDRAAEVAPDDPGPWTAKADMLAALGRHDEALAAYDRAAEVAPDDPGPWTAKADMLAALGRHDEALAAYDRAAEVAPDDPGPWTAKADMLAALGRHDEVLAAVQRAAEVAPDLAQSWLNVAVAFAALDRHDEALAAYDRAAEVAPDDPGPWTARALALRAWGRHDEALAAYDRAAEVAPDDPDPWTAKADMLAALGRHDEVLAAVQRAAEVAPDLAQSWLNVAVAFAALDRHDEALAAYDRAAEVAPDDPGPWTARALALRAWGRHDEALAAYDRAAEVAPDDPGPWTARALALRAWGRHDEALAAVQRAAEVAPDLAQSWLNVAVAFAALDRHDEALAAYDRAAEVAPDDPGPWTAKADMLAALGRHDEVLAAVQRAAEVAPDLAQSWLNVAVAFAALDRHDEALAAYDRAAEVAPDDPGPWTARALALRAWGRHDEALAAYDRAAEVAPDDPGPWTARALALRAWGRHDEALAAYDRAAEVAPDDPGPWTARALALRAWGRHDEVLAAVQRAAEVAPDLAQSWLNVAVAFAALDRHDEALAAYDRAAEVAPDDPGPWTAKADMLAALGRHDEALAAYDRAAEVAPDDPDPWTAKADMLAALGRHDEVLAAVQRAAEVAPDLAQSWLNVAVAFAALDRHDEALAAYDRAAEVAPDDPGPWTARALALRAWGRHDEALAAYDRAAEVAPDDPGPWTARALALRAWGRHDEALAAVQRAAEVAPDLAQSWLNVAVALRALDRHDEALAAYDRAAEVAPDDPGPWTAKADMLAALGRHDEVLAAVQRAAEVAPDLAQSWLNVAVAFAALDRHDEALAAYDRAAEVAPDDPDPWTAKADMLAALGRHDEALAAYDRAAEVAPDDPGPWTAKADMLAALGRHDEVLAAVQRAAEVAPDLAQSWLNVAVAFAALDRHDEALAAYDRAAEVAPDDPGPWTAKADMLAALGRHDEALAAYDRAAEVAPDDPDPWTAKADMLAALGRHDEVLAAVQRAAEVAPDLAQSWLNVAVAFAALDRHDEALAAYDRAAEVAPDDPGPWTARALALRAWGRHDEALAAVQRAAEVAPDLAQSWLNVAVALRALDRHDEALAAYDRAAEVAPDDPGPWTAKADMLAALGRHDEVLAAVQRAAEVAPDLAQSWLNVAVAFAALDRHDEALAAYDRAAEVAPDDPDPWTAKADMLAALGRHDEALAAVQRAAEVAPDLAQSWLNVAVAFAALDRHDEALAAYDRVLLLDSSDMHAVTGKSVVLRSMYRHEDAAAIIASALERLPSTPVLRHEQGRIYLDWRRYDEALAAFDWALQLDANDVDAVTGKSTVLRFMFRYQDAAAVLQSALERLPPTPVLLYEQGWLYQDWRRFDEALAAFDRALTLDPRDETAVEWKSTVLRSMYRYVDAETLLDDCSSLAIWSIRLRMERGWLYLDLRRYDEALAAFDWALQLNANDVDAVSGKSVVLRSMYRYVEAETLLDNYSSLAIWSIRLRMERGWLYFDWRRFDEALAAFDWALQLDANDVDAVTGKSTVLRFMFRYQDAAAVLQSALERLPPTPVLLDEQGWLYQDWRRYDEALAAFDRALTLDPRDETAVEWKSTVLRSMYRYVDAETLLDDCSSLATWSVRLRMERGWLYLDWRRYDEALAAFDWALQLDPHNQEAVEYRCRTLRRLRRHSEAKDELETFLGRGGAGSLLHVELAVVLADSGEIDEALARLSSAPTAAAFDDDLASTRIALLTAARRYEDVGPPPEYPRARNYRKSFVEYAWMQLRLHRLRAAELAADALLEIDSLDAQAVELKSIVLRSTNRRTGALNLVDDAIARFQYSPDLYAQRAIVLAELGRPEEAIVAAQLSLDLDPRHVPALIAASRAWQANGSPHRGLELLISVAPFAYGEASLVLDAAALCVAVGQREQAVTMLDQLVRLEPDNVDAVIALSALYRSLGRADESLGLITRTLERQSRNPALHVQLGRLRADTPDGQLESLLALDTAMNIDPHDEEVVSAKLSVLRRFHRYAAAHDLIRRYVGTEYTPSILIEAGELELARGRLGDAERFFRQAALVDPLTTDVFAGFAALSFFRADYDSAIGTYRDLIRREPGAPEHYVNLAYSVLKRSSHSDELQEASRLCYQAIDLDECFPSAWACLGVIDHYRGWDLEAEERLVRSVELGGFEGGDSVSLAALYISLARYADAVRVLTDTVASAPTDGRAFVELGSAYLGLEKPVDAATSFRTAIALGSVSDGTIGLAASLTMSSKFAVAERELRRACASSGASEELSKLHLALARTLFQWTEAVPDSDRSSDGLAEARRAAELDSQSAEAHYLIAVGLLRSGTGRLPLSANRRKASAHLKRAFTLDKDYLDARQLYERLRIPDTRDGRIHGGILVAAISVALLGLLWASFLLTDRVSRELVGGLTPVLLAVLVLSFLIPTVSHVKLAGVEADVDRTAAQVSSGPTGDVTIVAATSTLARRIPGRVSVSRSRQATRRGPISGGEASRPRR